jgi:hypothetical protein
MQYVDNARAPLEKIRAGRAAMRQLRCPPVVQVHRAAAATHGGEDGKESSG